MNVYLLIAFIVVLAGAAIAGLIALDHHLEDKSNERTGKIVCEDVIPAAEKALEDYTKSLLDDLSDRLKKGMENLKNM